MSNASAPARMTLGDVVSHALFGLGALMIAVAGARSLGWIAGAGDSWLAIICGFFLVFASRMDQVARISIGPLQAELREKLRETAATIEQLRQIAASLSEVVLAQAGAEYFQDGMPVQRRVELAEKTFKSLADIGVSPKDREQVRDYWDRATEMVFARALGHRIETAIRSATDGRPPDRKLPEFLTMRPWRAMSPDDIESEAAQRGVLTEEITKLIEDYRVYRRDRTYNRPTAFVHIAEYGSPPP